MFNIKKIRQDFPILSQKLPNGRPLVYLDNAATTQKPRLVIEAIQQYYSNQNANIHRGIYHLAAEATRRYELVRQQLRAFIGAKQAAEVVFTRGTTEGINLVAQSFALPRLEAGDEVLISAMEHHSNLLPWQLICKKAGAKLRIIPMNKKGELVLDDLDKLLHSKTKMLAINHVSNALGTINPLQIILAEARKKNIPSLIDAAQSVAYYPINVQELDCDFLVFSSHKMFGPMGIGVLYGKAKHLKTMSPYQYGGEMIRSVSFEESTFAKIPHKFEAGTPHVAGVLGLGAALIYLESLDKNAVLKQLKSLTTYATQQLQTIKGLQLIGTAKQKSAIFSFSLSDVHPHDIATILNESGVAVRAGHHCAQPIMDFFGVPATVRASFSFYNTKEEIDVLVEALKEVKKIFL